jgi:hypothetical protein
MSPTGWNLLRSQRAWFQANPIIHCVSKSLLTTQVAFRCLYRNVPKQELNLLQLAASLVTEPSACPPKVVRCMGWKLALLGLLFYDSPNDFRGETGSPNSASLVDRTQESPRSNSSRRCPRVDPNLSPSLELEWFSCGRPCRRDRLSPNVPLSAASLQCVTRSVPPYEVRNPAELPTWRSHACLVGSCRHRQQKALALFRSKPIANMHTQSLDTLNAANAGSQVSTQ